jgi:hypothetical protein
MKKPMPDYASSRRKKESKCLTGEQGFAFVAVFSLALGFALAATTLAVVNAYLLRSLPFPAANRLYHVIYAPTGVPEPRSVATLDWQSLGDVVEAADASSLARFYLGEGAEKREALGGRWRRCIGCAIAVIHSTADAVGKTIG